MKKLFIVSFLFITSIALAQDNINKALGTFTEVKAFDGISVKLIPSNENKAVIRGKNKSDVEIVNNNGVLKIRMDISEAFDGYNTYVDIYFSDRLTVLDANEQAFIENTEAFKQTDIELKTQEGGQISVYLDVDKLYVKSVTGGNVEAIGKAVTQEVKVNTGGEYDGKELASEQTVVSVNAGGYANVSATELADAKVRAGGTITIYGSPKVIEKQTFLGGDIRERS